MNKELNQAKQQSFSQVGFYRPLALILNSSKNLYKYFDKLVQGLASRRFRA